MAFRISTFNVLAESYAAPRNYTYVQPPHALNWSYRSTLINQILLSSQAHILLLQEVDHPEDFKVPLSATHELHFEQRPGNRRDGLLTAWDRARYQLIDSERINYNDLNATDLNATATPNPRLTRHNIGVVYLLWDAVTAKHVVVANTHLYWNPSCEDVKLLQARHLMCSCALFFQRNKLNTKAVPFFWAVISIRCPTVTCCLI